MRIARCAPNPKRLEAPCCKVLVMNGAGGRDVVRFFSIPRTTNSGHEPSLPVIVSQASRPSADVRLSAEDAARRSHLVRLVRRYAMLAISTTAKDK